uniref:Protein kinase domain-containing protein n=1 Tax=Pundamilia nyererei TaxID=303518 RepID=A0A3B4GT98_9CICH
LQKPLQPDMGRNSLANFQIEKKIGRGQFSEVYQARYLLDNTFVALKIIQVRMSPASLIFAFYAP